MRRFRWTLLGAMLAAGCGTASRDLVSENAGEPSSWSVPPLDCAAGSPQSDVSDDGSVTQFCHDGTSIQGTLIKWHPNAQKATQGDYRSGQRDGSWAWWHPNGKLATRGSFLTDRQEGVWTWWHANGTQAMVGDHVRGHRMGLWESWHDNGQLERSGHYSNGRQHGDWTTYTRSGEVKSRQSWDLGRLVEEKVLIEDEEPAPR